MYRGRRLALCALVALVASASTSLHAQTTTIPFELTDGRFVVSVSLDGEGPFRFAIDSGGINLVQPRVAARLHLKTVGRGIVHGLGTPGITTRSVLIPRLTLGPLTLRDQRAVVLGVPFPVDGLLGFELFERFCAVFDGPAMQLSLAPTCKPQGSRVALSFAGKIPVIRASVGGVPLRVAVDSGNNSGLILNEQFWQAHRAALPVAEHEVGSISGLRGSQPASVLEPVAFAAGGRELGKFTAVVLTNAEGMPSARSVDGNLGTQVLRTLRVTFDYRHRALTLVRP